MATLGTTKLQAVNWLLRSIKEGEASAVDSSGSWPSLTYGTSIQARAEYVLDEISKAVQSRGFQFNTARCVKYTKASPGTIQITSPANALRIFPSGPTQFKNLSIQSDLVYDLENLTTTFAIGDYFFDIIFLVDFAACPEDIKQLVMSEAAQVFQRQQRGDRVQDQWNAQERDKREVFVTRPEPMHDIAAPSMRPLITGAAQTQAPQAGN